MHEQSSVSGGAAAPTLRGGIDLVLSGKGREGGFRLLSVTRDRIAELPPILFACVVLPTALSPFVAFVVAFSLILSAVR